MFGVHAGAMLKASVGSPEVRARAGVLPATLASAKYRIRG